MPYYTNMNRVTAQASMWSGPKPAPMYRREPNCAMPQPEPPCCAPRPEPPCCASRPEPLCDMPEPQPCPMTPATHCVADPKNGMLLGELPLAMAYVPSQAWHKLYDGDKALKAGTLFHELNLPFTGCGAKEGCGCGR